MVIPVDKTCFGGTPGDWPDTCRMTQFLFPTANLLQELSPQLVAFIEGVVITIPGLSMASFAPHPAHGSCWESLLLLCSGKIGGGSVGGHGVQQHACHQVRDPESGHCICHQMHCKTAGNCVGYVPVDEICGYLCGEVGLWVREVCLRASIPAIFLARSGTGLVWELRASAAEPSTFSHAAAGQPLGEAGSQASGFMPVCP